MLSKTGHSIMAATDPRMYKYFSVNNSALNLEMLESGLFLMSKTPQGLTVLKDIVKCALIKDCMGPSNTTVYCITGKLKRNEYGNCHRYDQSALALSLAQCSINISDYFRPSDLVYVKRTENYNSTEWMEVKQMLPWIDIKKFI